ncbi:lactase-like protein isoform X1 [Sminthopsis crassicaudata]|uniref:lactase-like protein isoform X1 n=2 Tax=Sminthopsis crassicaudata TaxID=9301 RepID=UPI003D681155
MRYLEKGWPVDTTKTTTFFSLCYQLLLVPGLWADREFPWDDASFYYGTFPPGFSWGVGSSAYQTEGAWDQDGKGPSIWDTFTHHQRGRIFMNQTADSSCESYYKIQEDTKLLKELNVSHYRLSISWPRLIPTGVKADYVNSKGIKFYSDFINTLLENNITPIVTLYHWDLPQMLQVKFGGWQNATMVRYFDDYANLCFEKFGDQVKHWITFNDPWSIANKGYETGRHAPGLKLRGTGAYTAAHHIIKSHAKVWHSYHKAWRKKQHGLVGISLTCNWGEPVDITNPEDIEAAERYMQFCLGWFANPIYAGDYPQAMKDYIGRKSTEQGLGMSRLPVFSIHEKNDIKGTFDFLGLGHFTTRYVTQKNHPSRQGPSYQNDRDVAELVDPNWPDLGSNWPQLVPWGFRRLLNFVQTQYGNPVIYVTENGVSEKLNHIQLCDEWRIQYLKGYINEMLKAIKDGVNVKGYTSWSLLDTFEWENGYSHRYGFFYVEFNNKNKPRYPKASVQYYKSIITANGFPNPIEVERWYNIATETCSTTNQILAAEPLLQHMQMVTEIVVPTVCTLCILLSAVLLMFLLRKQS